MKINFLVLCLMIGFLSTAQQQSNKVVQETEGDLIKVSFFHPNGELAQQGYLKNNKLHGKWVQFSEEGEQLCLANYKMGKREGTWLFWTNGNLTQVDFANNKILNQVSWKSQTGIAQVSQ
jgi:antitoxin component YwqK of YwqJK toxin-antitoxin module